MIRGFEVNEFFSAVSGLADNYANSKVENGKRMVEQLAIDPKTIVMIGDTTHDYEVAEAIGVDCILIAHGHHPVEKLSQKTEVIHSFEELKQLL